MFGDPKLPKRIWDKIEINPDTGCWEWQAAKIKGYGQTGWQGKTALVHRLTYETLVGPIPKTYMIDHVCRVPRCVNPEHLEPVTHGVNQRRGVNTRADRAWRQWRAEGKCSQRHTITPDRMYVMKNGQPGCLTCLERVEARSHGW